jgi:DNA-binding MarR family transcriptional regulator/GNAT superfamily N-acetyltransferase
MSLSSATDVVRRFNRSYTQRIGALEESFLGLGLPLGTARLLFEIGTEPGAIQELRNRLGLDSGYLSRLLRRLQDDGLITVDPDPSDRRRRLVALTTRGSEVFDTLELRSRQRAASLLEPLTERQRDRLTTALATADLLVRAASITLQTASPAAPTARQATQAYFAELDQRFPDGFPASEQSSHDHDLMSPPNGAFTVALSDGRPVACGGVQTLEAGIGEIKRMWVHENWRGAGLGGRLLRHLETVAADMGHHTVRLDTNDTLTEAIALYHRSGYQQVPAYNDNPYARLWFEKNLATVREPVEPERSDAGTGTDT